MMMLQWIDFTAAAVADADTFDDAARMMDADNGRSDRLPAMLLRNQRHRWMARDWNWDVVADDMEWHTKSSGSMYDHDDIPTHRWLGGGGSEDFRIDYSVLSVGVMTLGLIMIVELMRHRLDHAAHHRPFFKAVLDGVYAELATLGIVEFFLHLLGEYHEGLDLAKKTVFSDVHFALFYTAILNAFQSVILACCANWLSQRLWIRTEMLELNHYVEIREEFERIKLKLELLQKRSALSTSAGNTPPLNSTTNDKPSSSSSAKDFKDKEGLSSDSTASDNMKDDLSATVGPTNNNNNVSIMPDVGRMLDSATSAVTDQIVSAYDNSRTTLLQILQGVIDMIKYPQLKRKYNTLLVQIRYHELRVHLIQAYNLPLKLRISDYLIRSERAVLIRLVQVSTVAWLLLTGAINVLYYSLGILSYETEHASIIGAALIWIFYLCMAIFVLIAVLVYYKMKSVVAAIMLEKTLWDVHAPQSQERARLADQQRALFWFGDPKLVIAAIQFMQFGYAVSLSVVIIFWEEINDGSVTMGVYLLAIAVAYTIFVIVTAQVIPEYTLCTCLGQLVHERRLHETVAAFQLEQAKRHALEQQLLAAYEKNRRFRTVQFDLQPSKENNPPSLPPSPAAPVTQPHEAVAKRSPNTLSNNVLKPHVEALTTARRAASGVVEDLIHPNMKSSVVRSSARPPFVSSSSSSSLKSQRISIDSAALFAELVKMDTVSLRTSLPAAEREQLTQREVERQRRRQRRKTMSDGVAAMASIRNLNKHQHMSPAAEGLMQNQSDLHSKRNITTRDDIFLGGYRKRGSFSQKLSIKDIIQEGEPVTTPRDDNDSIDKLQPDDTKKDRLLARSRLRGSRRKSVSDGVAFMAGLADMGVFEEAKEEEQIPVDSMRSFRAGGVAIEPLEEASENSTSHHDLDLSFADIWIGKKKHALDRVREHTATQVVESLDDIHASSSPVQVVVAFESSESDTNKLGQTGKVVEQDADSTESVGDFSDSNDVPEVDLATSVRLHAVDSRSTPSTSFREQLADYFLSRKYAVISNVLGTMIAFFLVGQRVESFLHSQGIISGEFVSFDFAHYATFWILTTWLAMFIMVDFLVLWSVHPPDSDVQFKWRLISIMSAIIDLALSGGSLTALFVAEARRCCYPEESSSYSGSSYSHLRGLAGDSAGDVYLEEQYYAAEIDSVPAPCGCPMFGSRMYGGLGQIEPYTALIGLRIFRQWFAYRVFCVLDQKFGLTGFDATKSDVPSRHTGIRMDPFAVFGKDDKQDAHHGKDTSNHRHGEEEKGTIAELWESAIGKYPEIVTKHGEFSGELLRAMLGVSLPPTAAEDELDQNGSPIGEAHPDVVEDATIEARDDGHPSLAGGSTAYALSREYSSLPAKAQEIIMAGQLGRAVRCTSIRSSQFLTSYTSIPEDDESLPVTSVPRALSRSLVFEVDVGATSDLPNELESLVTSPNARLVRSMRRCDKKLLPLGNAWKTVDVVLTRFEIVYFEASDLDDTLEATETIRQALRATKGGKGLRLCDVATGRKVLGHVPLSEIDSILVEREMPGNERVEPSDADRRDVRLTENWRTTVRKSPEGVLTSREQEWRTLKQDRLKIQNRQGVTLYLRFYSDLEDAESHPDRLAAENEAEGPLFKNNAFQWAQTLIRFCGPEQLHQSLPHFADDTSEELRDFLIVHHVPEADHHKGQRRTLISAGIDGGDSSLHRPRGHQRSQTYGDGFFRTLSVLPRRHVPEPSMASSLHLSSFGEKSTDIEASSTALKAPAKLRRVVSFGEKGPVAPPIPQPMTLSKSSLLRSKSDGTALRKKSDDSAFVNVDAPEVIVSSSNEQTEPTMRLSLAIAGKEIAMGGGSNLDFAAEGVVDTASGDPPSLEKNQTSS